VVVLLLMSAAPTVNAQGPGSPGSASAPGVPVAASGPADRGGAQKPGPSASPETALSLEQIDQKLRDAPRNPQWRFLRGVALVAAQRTAEAQGVFEKLITDHPELPEPYNNLAVIRASLNDWEGARQVLVQAVQVLPSYALAHENLGEVYLRLAEAAWAQAARISPPGASALQKLTLTRELLTRIADLAPSESPNPRSGASSPTSK
jgi:tetratricopeptide (TPR) repeat protein